MGRPSMFTDEENQFMKDNYKNMSYKEIADILGYTERQIRGRINNMGLTKNRDFNKRYFQYIDTPEKAYYLGFIFADGYLIEHKENRNAELGWELQSQDGYILKKFDDAIGGDHIIYHKEACERMIVGNLCHKQPSDILRIYSKEMVNDLISHGVVPRKTYKKEYPVVSDDLFFDFLRGYIDGDGCYHVDKNNHLMMHITCAFDDVLIYIKDILNKHGIKSSIYQELERKYRLYCYNKESISKLLHKLYYKTDILCLKRKFDIISPFLNQAPPSSN